MNKYIFKIKKLSVFFWNKFIDIKILLSSSLCILLDTLITKNIYPKPSIESIDETIETILKNKCSVSRFGDGEFKLMMGDNISFQRNTDEICKRLRQVLISEEQNIIICIPDVFNRLDVYEEEWIGYWKLHIAKNRRKWYRLLRPHKNYYNAFISRCYYGIKDKSSSIYRFNKLKQIWEGREVVIIEGQKSRLGIGNDLFNNVKSIRRILCPEEHAFDKYPLILAEASKVDKTKLILLAVGPTATILAYDLSKLGYQAIDIGHIDIEYEWYLMGATKKEKIKNKYVCEAGGGVDVGECTDRKYRGQITCSIT